MHFNVNQTFSSFVKMPSISLRFTTYLKTCDVTRKFTQKNFYSTCKKIIFEKQGDPFKVLKLVEESLPKINSNEVLIKFLVSPINQADINFIQGVYPIKATLPAIAGFEGVAQVLEVGNDVQEFQVGDKVVPNMEAFGTWRTVGICKAKHLYKLPNDISTIEAAGLTSNPCTAYRMLNDFCYLQPGDVVIQNGGNSACAQNVIQLCRIHKFISVNVVRQRPDIDKLKEYLKSLGADYVLTEEELRTTSIFKNEISKAQLALNCIGGKSSTELTRHMKNGSLMVTYGGMSREPVSISTGAFIFKDITFKGFWMTRWMQQNRNSEERHGMYNDLVDYIRHGELKAPVYELVPFTNFQDGISMSSCSQGFSGKKYMLNFQSEE